MKGNELGKEMTLFFTFPLFLISLWPIPDFPNAEMPTSSDLKSGDSLFFTTPTLQISTDPPPTNWTSPQWEWLRTLYEVLHELHTIKIHDHRFDAEIIFVSG